MKAVLWPYQYRDMRETWHRQMCWIVAALRHHGVEVRRHADFRCRGLEDVQVYSPAADNPADICIYNHTDWSVLTGNVLRARANWFFKPTVPDEVHATLDMLGYGPYSSIGYWRPPFLRVGDEEVGRFFANEVAGWIKSRVTKWGTEKLAGMRVPEDLQDYNLVLGQCAGDTVVTKMDFGDYVSRLYAVVRELRRVDPDRQTVVKLHPWMNGRDGEETPGFAEGVATRLGALGARVFTGKSNVHAFIERARVVLLANSGAGFEAMMHRKPIIAWGSPEYRWIAYDLRHLCDMRRALTLDWFKPACQDKFLCWYLAHYCFYDQESAVRRVGELLSPLKEVCDDTRERAACSG